MSRPPTGEYGDPRAFSNIPGDTDDKNFRIPPSGGPTGSGSVAIRDGGQPVLDSDRKGGRPDPGIRRLELRRRKRRLSAFFRRHHPALSAVPFDPVGDTIHRQEDSADGGRQPQGPGSLRRCPTTDVEHIQRPDARTDSKCPHHRRDPAWGPKQRFELTTAPETRHAIFFATTAKTGTAFQPRRRVGRPAREAATTFRGSR